MPIENYVVDFCCESARLIIELDGGQHTEQGESDRIRTTALEKPGYLVLRFWNNDVIRNTEGVVESIVDTLNPRPPHPDPLLDGEREKRARGAAAE